MKADVLHDRDITSALPTKNLLDLIKDLPSIDLLTKEFFIVNRKKQVQTKKMTRILITLFAKIGTNKSPKIKESKSQKKGKRKDKRNLTNDFNY